MKRMKSWEYRIQDSQGIHARPAAELVKEAKKFASTVKMDKNGRSADCKKMLALMSLGVKAGETVTFTFEGEDEEEACSVLGRFVREHL